jgi:hypothetical protein
MAAHPEEAKLFQTNWVKLNAVVTDELSKIVPPAVPTGGKRTKSSKKTRRTKRI